MSVATERYRLIVPGITYTIAAFAELFGCQTDSARQTGLELVALGWLDAEPVMDGDVVKLWRFRRPPTKAGSRA